MAQYINKDSIVAEIEKQIECAKFKAQQAQEDNDYVSYVGWSEHFATCGDILKRIDTLEVKEEFKIGETEIYLEDDGGEPPYDGKQWLDLSCREYEIPSDKFKDGDYVEIIIRKTQGGE